ncbi:MAG: prolyl oligopeptidase family serine peptidase [Fimbriimonadales bacterium]|nr:prolyl oligopeptidase family serine peptidase [Fimbriimonadales bacterium]
MVLEGRYPEAKRLDLVETLHGVEVADPYRWLEESDSEDTRRWIREQNELTRRVLDSVPERAAFAARLKELMDFERFGLPVRRGDRLFYSYWDGKRSQPVLMVEESGGEPRQLLDPNSLSEDGKVALSSWSPSEDGRWVAYALSTGGSDWLEWRVLDAESGKDLPDRLQWSKFSGASWLPDGTGFFYSGYEPPSEVDRLQAKNEGQRLLLHRLGTPQESDLVVCQRPDQPQWGFSGGVSEDGRWLVVTVWTGTDRRNRVLLLDLADVSATAIPLFDRQDARYGVLASAGDRFWVWTDRDAPMGKICLADARRPEELEDLVPECDLKLQWASLVGRRLFAVYLRDACSVVRVFEEDGTPVAELPLPGLGTVGSFEGRRADDEAFFVFTSFVRPPTLYRLGVEDLSVRVWRAPQAPFDPERFEVRQQFYAGRDGTRIPLFLVHERGLSLDGQRPTLLGGYGGFGIPVVPAFQPADVLWLERGGVVAVANLRGGGEYGNAWHDAGRLANKQNVFDDFIAAAEHLVRTGVTRPERLAIRGGSNGGLLVGACLTQRPDLFGACVPYVGVLDMLRFHKFTIGWAWVSDYGDPEDPEAFRWLLAYSPYHNVRPGTRYPATLVVTGDHDDRVVPLHSYKFAAALQHSQAGKAPILIRIETRAGHGAGKPLWLQVEESADVFAFLAEALR